MFRNMIIFRFFLLGIIETLIFFPIIHPIAIFTLPNEQILTWLICLVILVYAGFIFGLLVKDQKRWIYILFSIVMTGILAYLLMDDMIAIVVSAIIGFAFTLRGASYSFHISDNGYTTPLTWAFYPIYFFMYFFYIVMEVLKPYLEMITWIGIVTFVLTLFYSNSQSLQVATLSKNSNSMVGKTIRMHNRIYIAITVVIILIITNFTMIQSAIKGFFAGILHAIQWFMGLFTSDEPMIDDTEPAQEQAPILPEPEEGSAFLEFIEKIVLNGFLVMLAIAGLVLIIYFITKFSEKIRDSFKFLFSFIQRIFNMNQLEDEEEQYIDEKESIGDLKSFFKNMEGQVRDRVTNLFKKELQLEDMKTNKEKVRFIYRHLIQRSVKDGYEFKPSNTPKETIVELKNTKDPANHEEIFVELESAYESARYSDKEIDDKIIDVIKPFNYGK